MSDDQKLRLRQQANETRSAFTRPPQPPWTQVRTEQVSAEITPVMPVVTPESAEFAAQLQRLADTMGAPRPSRWATLEALCWTGMLLCLISVVGLGAPALLISVMLGLLATMTGKYKRLESRYLQSQIAMDLAQYDTSWLGPLALALESPRPAMRPIAAQLLMRILPMSTAEDFERLNSYERSCLYRRLIPNEEIDPALAQAILGMLEPFGDRESLRYVERLVYGLAGNVESRRLRTYARVCMAHMHDRLQRPDQESNVASASAPQVELARNAEATPQERWAMTQVETQLKLLEEEKRKRQPGIRIGFLIASWCVIVPYCAAQTWQAVTAENWATGMLWGLATGCATQLHRLCLSSRQTEAARKLAQYDDVRGVGPLAEALEWPDPDVQTIAMRALTRLLPHMQATDSALLTPEQRGNLYRRLNAYQARFQPEVQQFQLAILKALEQVGDAAAIPHVQKLANSVAFSRQQQQVRQAARDCLPYLRTRAEQHRISQTLLRASSATSSAPEALLRPVNTRATDAPEQLLRATNDNAGS